MKACNTQAKAKQLEGAVRNRFMTTCLNGDGHARELTARLRRHEQCDGRRDFLTQCEKGEVKATSEREQQKSCARRADRRRLVGDDRRDS
jgi:hypothetical protein